jgi:hypothetical protein
VVPHITIQSLHLRVGEFESHLAKRLLQQYRHLSDMAGLADDVGFRGYIGSRISGPSGPSLIQAV